MTTYRTGNPIGSTAVKDLYDNAENLDIFINDRTKETAEDRLGEQRLTWNGIETRAQIEISAAEDARDQAIAAAEASGSNVKFAQTYADAQALLPLTDGTVVEVFEDENNDDSRTRYIVESGALVFAVYLDQTKRDLANTADPAKGAGMVAFLRSLVYPKGSVGKAIVDFTSGIYPVKSYWEESDGADYGPAIRRAYQAAGAAGSGIVLFPPGTIYVKSLGDNPDFVIPIDSTLDGVTQFQRGNIKTVGFGVGNSWVILDVNASDRDFFGFVRRLNYCSFEDIVINANGKAKRAFNGAKEYNPYLVTDRVRFRGGLEYAAEIATYVSEFRSTQYTNSKRGLRLRGIALGPVTSVTLTSCYANANDEVGFDCGYLTYCAFNSCAGDHNELTYSFESAYGVTLNGCGTESSNRALWVGNYRGFTINGFFTLNMGDPNDKPDYMFEFVNGRAATMAGIYDRESFANYSYAVGSTGSGNANESITVLDNSIRRNQIYQVPTFNKDRPITLLIGDRTQKNETYNVSSVAEWQEVFSSLRYYEVNHVVTINVDPGEYPIDDVAGLVTALRDIRGGGRIDIVGNSPSPGDVIIYSNNNMRIENVSCYVRLIGVTISGKSPNASATRIDVRQVSNLFIDYCRILRNANNIASAIRAERGSTVVLGENNTITGPWVVSEFQVDSSSRILTP